MRYRTVIEVICDAANADDAVDIAGDYLSGKVDFGVEMASNTVSMRVHKIRKFAISGLAAVVLLSVVLVKLLPAGSVSAEKGSSGPVLCSTYTVMPTLKTSGESEFKNQWEEKKDEAVLNYIKN